MGALLKIYMMGCQENCSKKPADVIHTVEAVRRAHELARFISTHHNHTSVTIIKISSLSDSLGSVQPPYLFITNTSAPR